ncbi:hypothetical protein WR25_22120 isoform A [Diploscapter pachys]|uniref:Uncharacterized protein n=1 Tax=Diploscapter pachys TaxID=2018661 RepID=A0A2A2M0P6_9BILA|nr:hypothetical protein WR25_22120 isoform A [Diploscapter pachys]
MSVSLQRMPAFAYDLGSAYSKLAFLNDRGFPEVLEHEARRLTHSQVAFSMNSNGQGDIHVGMQAYNYISVLPNSIYDIRRLIGKKSSVSVPERNHFFRTTSHPPEPKDKHLEVILQPKGEKEDEFWAAKMPEDVLKHLFDRLHKSALAKCSDEEVNRVAIVVPLKSSEDYIRRVKYAARDVVAEKKMVIVEEPVAAVATYLKNRINLKPGKEELVLSFCMGAGYLQIAKCTVGNDAEKGLWIRMDEGYADEELAGSALDKLVEDRMKEEFVKAEKAAIGEKADDFVFEKKVKPVAQRRFRLECQKVKEVLSNTPHTAFQVDSLYQRDSSADEDPVDFELQLTKEEMQEICDKIIKRVTNKAWKMYKTKGIRPKYIIVSGGSTRIPLISECLRKLFPTATYYDALNQDEIAVIGAAMIAGGSVEVVVSPSLLVNQTTPLTHKRASEKNTEPVTQPPPSKVVVVGDGTGVHPKASKVDESGNESGEHFEMGQGDTTPCTIRMNVERTPSGRKTLTNEDKQSTVDSSNDNESFASATSGSLDYLNETESTNPMNLNLNEDANFEGVEASRRINRNSDKNSGVKVETEMQQEDIQQNKKMNKDESVEENRDVQMPSTVETTPKANNPTNGAGIGADTSIDTADAGNENGNATDIPRGAPNSNAKPESKSVIRRIGNRVVLGLRTMFCCLMPIHNKNKKKSDESANGYQAIGSEQSA